MSFRLGEEEGVFEASSCGYSSGGESGDEGDRFPDSGAHRRQSAPPQAPLRKMDSDSIYDMSGMRAHLPAKKGLSMYYQGKSQSFACMSEVRRVEDLKKEKPPRKSLLVGPWLSNKQHLAVSCGSGAVLKSCREQ